jgi:hypothetical protein
MCDIAMRARKLDLKVLRYYPTQPMRYLRFSWKVFDVSVQMMTDAYFGVSDKPSAVHP